jgi:hypothetical protein
MTCTATCSPTTTRTSTQCERSRNVFSGRLQHGCNTRPKSLIRSRVAPSL